MLYINHGDIGKHLDVLDRYDVIITTGTIEYLVNTSDNENSSKKFSDNVHKLLLPDENGLPQQYIFLMILIKRTFSHSLLKYYLKNEDSLNLYNLYYLYKW